MEKAGTYGKHGNEDLGQRMKNILTLILLMVSLVSYSQKVEKGDLNGTAYTIVMPDNWKGKLVMFAHGYEFMGSPKISQNPKWSESVKVFTDRGYAVAASDYSVQGYALPQGVDDTEALRQHFIKTHGKVDTTYMVGISMGGGIALAMLENFGKNYHGALPLCPLSSRMYLQCRKEFDMYATFNGLFPGVVSSLKDIFDVSKDVKALSYAEMGPKIMAIRSAIIKKDSALAVAFAKRFSLKLDDLPGSLFFNENVLRDLAHKAKGNPFDNTNTVYHGYPDDVLVNTKAERLKATVDPNVIFSKYDRTGQIDKPVVLVHTMYDQLIPLEYGVTNFANMVHQNNKDKYLVVKYTNGQGHCAFTPQQIGDSFDDLRSWVKTGSAPKPGMIE